jgi:hypothetical protein
MVRAAAEHVGVSESKVRAAYRRGEFEVRDDLVGGRIRKLVHLPEVCAWAGVAAPAATANQEDFAGTSGALVAQLEEIAEQVHSALDRASRAEQHVIFLRNELAQLRESHGRVQEIVDQRSLSAFQAVTSVAASTALAPVRRRRFLGLSWRASA